MANGPKTHTGLTEDQKEIVNEIIKVCVVKVHYLVTTFDDPGNYAKEIRKLSRSKKNYYLFTVLSKVNSLTQNQFIFPSDVRSVSYDTEEIKECTMELLDKSPTYLKSWEAQEALQDLVDKGLLLNIRGKKELRKTASELLPPLPKGRGSENRIKWREGYPSGYRITNDLALLNEVLSNPEALAIIHGKLKSHGVLEKFYYFICSALMLVLMEEQEKMLKLATVASQTILQSSEEVATLLRNIIQTMRESSKEAEVILDESCIDHKGISYSVWKKIPNYLHSLNEAELEKLVRDMVTYLLENPIDHSYILIDISKA
jgi:hypothetical protein